MHSLVKCAAPCLATRSDVEAEDARACMPLHHACTRNECIACCRSEYDQPGALPYLQCTTALHSECCTGCCVYNAFAQQANTCLCFTKSPATPCSIFCPVSVCPCHVSFQCCLALLRCYAPSLIERPTWLDAPYGTLWFVACPQAAQPVHGTAIQTCCSSAFPLNPGMPLACQLCRLCPRCSAVWQH
jgi:hypothetical protein